MNPAMKMKQEPTGEVIMMNNNQLEELEEDQFSSPGLVAFGRPTPAQMIKINALAKKELSPEDVFTYKNMLVGDQMVPRRYIRIHKSMLEAMLKNVKQGVAQIDSHLWASGWGSSNRVIPYGRSYDGVIKRETWTNPDTGEEVRAWNLYADFYMPMGLEIDGVKTDDLAKGIETGVIFDTSIGWYADRMECSICSNDIRDYKNCPHVPGMTYEEDGGLCFVWAKPPGGLMENSFVFDGAYPGAGICMDAGQIRQQTDTQDQSKYTMIDTIKDIPLGVQVYATYSRHGVDLFVPRSQMSLLSNQPTDYHRQHDELHSKYIALSAGTDIGMTMAEVVEAHRSCAKHILDSEHGAHEITDALDGTLPAALKKLSKGSEEPMLEQKLQALQQKYDGLTKLVKESLGFSPDAEIARENILQALDAAKESVEAVVMEALGIAPEIGFQEGLELTARDAEQGRKYRQDVIDTALASGIRDQGNDFPAETYRKMFDALSVDEIKSMGEKWEQSATAKLGFKRHSDAGSLELSVFGADGQVAKVDDEVYSMKKLLKK